MAFRTKRNGDKKSPLVVLPQVASKGTLCGGMRKVLGFCGGYRGSHKGLAIVVALEGRRGMPAWVSDARRVPPSFRGVPNHVHARVVPRLLSGERTLYPSGASRGGRSVTSERGTVHGAREAPFSFRNVQGIYEIGVRQPKVPQVILVEAVTEMTRLLLHLFDGVPERSGPYQNNFRQPLAFYPTQPLFFLGRGVMSPTVSLGGGLCMYVFGKVGRGGFPLFLFLLLNHFYHHNAEPLCLCASIHGRRQSLSFFLRTLVKSPGVPFVSWAPGNPKGRFPLPAPIPFCLCCEPSQCGREGGRVLL
mmetsp:Transcript_39313/g.100762  ORF Transcript_39313/g.100762 Transcript_39313/m.100762 type:complete len:304 (-) Transcript_39313:925-1836(-)